MRFFRFCCGLQTDAGVRVESDPRAILDLKTKLKKNFSKFRFLHVNML